MKAFSFLLVILLCAYGTIAHAQPEVTDFKSIFRLEIQPTETPIEVDGKLEDTAWKKASVGTDFWQKVPYFEECASPHTEIMLTYDDNNLYVAAKCYQEEDILVQSLRRDVYWDNDGIAILLDPLNTRTNGFLFGVTAANAQWDALRSLDDNNTDWSNKWFSGTFVGNGFWSMEMAIPLRILRFGPEDKEWGMNFVRNHMNENEYHNWTAVPESFWPPDPAFAGALVFETPPKPKKGNYNIIPYITASASSQKDEDPSQSVDVGLDARVSVTPTLNLDLTVNPDFSQIEVDQLVTNLTRFNIFLPERRTFFLENSDIFADYGYPAARPFFSRTIGLDADRQAVPIVYGARLTGNVNKTIRLGVMNIHSGSSVNNPAQNQSAVSVQKLFGRSFVKGVFLNRQSFEGTEAIEGDYGRNAGLEAAYVSDDGQVSLWGSAHYSFKDQVKEKTAFYNSGFSFTNPNWEFLIANGYVQENYFADMGFVQRIENYDAVRDTTIRLGYNENVLNLTYRIRPKSDLITRHNISTFNTVFLNPDWSFQERINQLNYSINFRSTAVLQLSANSNEINLVYPFRFVTGGQPLPAANYKFAFASARFSSDERKAISYTIRGRTGDFYNGQLHQANGSINFRWQPWVNWSFGYQWNHLDFPDQYGEETITALLSTLEIGFNPNLLWTTLFQYLDQAQYLGVNSRLQWRFAPMSDLFFVYVDNYDVLQGVGGPRQIFNNNRAVILKVNYWY